MQPTIHAFIPYLDDEQAAKTASVLRDSSKVTAISLLSTDADNHSSIAPILRIDALTSSETMRKIIETSEADYILFYNRYDALQLGYKAIDRLLRIATDSEAVMLYSDYSEESDGSVKSAPTIDYQFGSLRDDFNFGPLVLIKTSAAKKAVEDMTSEYKAAGFYDLRLRLSRIGTLEHINEPLYRTIADDRRTSGEKMFDYVDPRNRANQIEMEYAVTDHLKAIGGYLAPTFSDVDFAAAKDFAVTASVIIPVRNRIRTIRDAIRSALSQQSDFPFNVIVIDNHSTDGTTEAIAEIASNDNRVIHLLPERNDLGIGGCWNTAIHHNQCGAFAVQLDSDDIYEGTDTLQRVVDTFHRENCAMVVGSYRLTDINCNTIPPGLIDHKEWTPDNGRNNALRINGLGAPRAFFTPLLREIQIPNTCYGEDYALGLGFSRRYRIGRIWDSLYCCRRWEDNSDANLNIEKTNANNLYKDRIRTWELKARIRMNQSAEK